MGQSKFIMGLAGLLGVVAFIWNRNEDVSTIVYWSASLSISGFFAALILVAIPEITLLIDRTFTEHVKLKYDRRDPILGIRPSKEPVDAPVNTVRDNLIAAWVEYWIAALHYAEQEGGVSFTKSYKFFSNDWVTWRKCFAEPMARWGQFAPIEKNVETVPSPGQSVQKIRWKLESGFRPDLSNFPPFVPPAHFERSTEANKEAKKEEENTRKTQKVEK